jgi:predicted metal-binding membrane protein
VRAAGSNSVWIGFALAASRRQYKFNRTIEFDPAIGSGRGLLSGAILIGVGACQF